MASVLPLPAQRSCPANLPAVAGQLPPHRPTTRAECEHGPRPCPWLSCAYHMAWMARTTVSLIKQGDEWDVVEAIEKLPCSCVLDMTVDPMSERDISEVLGITHQAVAQIVTRAKSKLLHPSRAITLAELYD